MTTVAANTDGAEYNGIEIGQGFDCDFAMQVVDSNGAAVDLTGYTVRMQLRLGYTDPVALTASSAVAGSSYIAITGASGLVNVHLDHADTLLLSAPKQYVFDVRFKAPGGAETRKLWGKAFVRPMVTTSA